MEEIERKTMVQLLVEVCCLRSIVNELLQQIPESDRKALEDRAIHGTPSCVQEFAKDTGISLGPAFLQELQKRLE